MVNSRSIKILLVEDQEFNQLLIKKLARNWNYNLDIATGGREALNMFQKNHYDVILMDIQLPQMSGTKITEKIRNDFPEQKKNIPIIALTAYALEGDKEKYLAAGMNEYIAKPFKSEDLHGKILKSLKKNAYPEQKNKKESSEIAQSLFNLDKVIEISKGDKSFVREMILVFLDQCEEIKYMLEIALAEKDMVQLGKSAHKLKGSIHMMGLKSLQKEIKEIVNISRNKKPDPSIFKLTKSVLAELQKIIPILKAESIKWDSN